MKCDRCKEDIEEGEERELHGQTLCEDCYIDTRYPLTACDPWAVYSATKSRETQGLNGTEGLTELQKAITSSSRERVR